MALVCSSRLVILLLPQDLRVQHPLLACPPSPQGYRKVFDHVHFRDWFSDDVSWSSRGRCPRAPIHTPSQLPGADCIRSQCLHRPYLRASLHLVRVVFIGIYQWREQLLGLSFHGLFTGAFLVMPPFFAYLYYVQEPKYNANGELKLEERMPVAIVGALLIPICLFWFGWTSRTSVHWIVPIIGSSLFSITALLLFMSIPTRSFILPSD